MKLSLIALAALSLATITGCSKSGGGSDTPVDNTPVVSPALTKLYGQTTIGYAFTYGSNIYGQQVLFGSDDAQFDTELQDYVLRDTSSTIMADSSGNNYVNTGTNVIYCTAMSDALILCAAGKNDNATAIDLFLFDTPVNGESLGNFEWCSNTANLDTCVNSLVNSPDGFAVIDVDSSVSTRTKQPTTVAIDDLPYRQYDKQGTTESGIVTDNTELVNAARALLAK